MDSLCCWVIGTLAFVSGIPLLGGEAVPRSYASIVERNVFKLKAAATDAPSALRSNAPPIDVKLTGLTEFGPLRRAFLETVNQGRLQRLNLGEGEKEGFLEIVAINVQTGTVYAKYMGTELMLGFPTREHAQMSAYLRKEERLGQEHGRYHEIRARLEREQDQRERLAFEMKKQAETLDRSIGAYEP